MDDSVELIMSTAERTRYFAAEFNPFLTEDERFALKKHADFMELAKDEIENGEAGTHYAFCHWAKPNARSGPDTCVCVHNLTNSRRANAIIRRYEGLKRRVLGL